MQTGLIATAAVWLVAEVLMVLFDRGNSWIGPSSGVYVFLIWVAVAAIVRKNEAAEDDVLRTQARGPRLWLRMAVVLATTLAIVGVYTLWFPGIIKLPWLGPIYRGIEHAVPLGSGPFNFLLYALIPGVILLLLGTKLRELGLTRSAPRTGLAAIPCFILPAIFVVMAMLKGHWTVGMLAWWVAHNFLSNGFSEEFFTRGMVFSHARAFLRKDWALFAQAMIFSLLHFGVTLGPEEHGNVIMAIANVISENTPMAIVMGLMALRTRSLLLPALVHTSLDTMKDLVM